MRVIKSAATCCVGVCFSLFFASSIWGVELITNGGFETGDFTGWTATTNADGVVITELTPWQVTGAGAGWFNSSSPLSGNFDALNGFDGDAGLIYELYQDVAIPAGNTATLETNHRIVFDGLGILSTLDRVFEVSIRDTANMLLQSLYSESITLNGVSQTDLGWNNQSFDVSAHAGSTVRVHFREFIPESYTGPANIELDNISLSAVPEPTSLALVCFAICALGMHRRA